MVDANDDMAAFSCNSSYTVSRTLVLRIGISSLYEEEEEVAALVIVITGATAAFDDEVVVFPSVIPVISVDNIG